MDQVETTFTCISSEDQTNMRVLRFGATSKGNDDITDGLTAVGTIQIGIGDKKPAFDFFKPHKNYKVTFEEIPD